MGFGGFAGLGFWREEIDLMHRHLVQGDVVIGVEAPPERQASAEEALRTAGAKDVRASRSKKAAVREVESSRDV